MLPFYTGDLIYPCWAGLNKLPLTNTTEEAPLTVVGDGAKTTGPPLVPPSPLARESENYHHRRRRCRRRRRRPFFRQCNHQFKVERANEQQ